ncbi:sulfite oxidase [Streptomyces sp. NBC_00503]|uniref:sulfite oxidase n=1 Tax=Streptomyces sp. NBC_00503 TaxID=2903659 RepID=UPI002E80BF9C|nr:sulfite oxidase [Streptomyces sp. NBC_00503]WUD82701.1 sulfite oxidase [Streptomyces sp. NBC_00503]
MQERSLDGVGAPSRVAAAGEGIGQDELALAARNHGLPLEAMRYEVTPAGLHYVLVHYDIPDTLTEVESDTWRLTVHGHLRLPLRLGLRELRALPAVTRRVTMECAGNGRARLSPRPVSQPWLVEAVGTADWTGVPLRTVLAEAGVAADAVEAVFTGADHGVERGVEQDYRRSLPLPVDADVLLAHTMNGSPLPPQHGYPLRLVVPGWYGMAHVKWLRDIELVDAPFRGFQQAVAYRYRQSPEDPGEPVTRIAPRALLIPPGFPDFMSRTRVVHPGPVRLRGRAWSGYGAVVRVEFSADGGRGWADAELLPRGAHPYAWQGWHADWTATPGSHTLLVRATDGSGRTQPLEQPWNRGGFGNNLVQSVPVVCC